MSPEIEGGKNGVGNSTSVFSSLYSESEITEEGGEVLSFELLDDDKLLGDTSSVEVFVNTSKESPL